MNYIEMPQFSKYYSNLNMSKGLTPLMQEGIRILWHQSWSIEDLAKQYRLSDNRMKRELQAMGLILLKGEDDR